VEKKKGTGAKKKSTNVKNNKSLIEAAREGDNISTLRDILFGNKIAEYEKRFKDLEDRITQEVSGLREETERLYNSLESFIKDEQKALSERHKEEQEDRETADRRMREELESFGKKLTAHKEENADAHRDLRQLLLEQNKSLSDESQHLRRELTGALEHKIAELQEKKVNRLALADLLTEMAMQLGQEPGEPGDEQK
jgi:hypothetical protein